VIQETSLYKKFRLFLRSTLDLREGEMQRALLMQFYIFLIITTLLVVKPTANAMFLSRFGVSQLPFAFILVAIVAAIVTMLYSTLVTKVELNKIMDRTLRGSIVFLILFGVFLHFRVWQDFILYLFYIWVAVFALLTTSQFWLLANIVFNARQAKRLFGFVGAGAIAGGIFGGYLATILTGFISSAYLPIVATIFLIFCIFILRKIWKKEVLPNQTSFRRRKKIVPVSNLPFIQIKNSKHLTYIAFMVAISVIVAKLVDYQFSAIASELIPDPDNLTAFFGFWFSTFNVISLFIQLFLTKGIVGKFGVGYSLFLLPVSILFAVILLLFMPGVLLAAVFLKLSEGGLKQSVNKAAMELLMIPIPQVVKKQTKTFIDVFVDSLATGVSGLILIFIVQGLNLTHLSINIIIITFLVMWFYVAFKVRGEYFKSFRRKIDSVVSSTSKSLDFTNQSVIAGMRKLLETGTERQILYALKKNSVLKNKRFFKSISKLLAHPSVRVRAAAIKNLNLYKSKHLYQEIEEMLLTESSHKVKTAAFDYLLRHGTKNTYQYIDTYLHHINPIIASAVMFSLAKEAQINPKFKSAIKLEEIILEKMSLIKDMDAGHERDIYTIGVIKSIGKGGLSSLYDKLFEYIKSDDQTIALAAVTAAGRTMHPKFLGLLIKRLGDKNFEAATRKALLQYGPAILDVLIKAFEEQKISLKALRRFPGIVKQIPSKKAVAFLIGFLDYPDYVVRQEALRGLSKLRNSHPDLAIDDKMVITRVLNEAHNYQQNLSVLYAQTRLHAQSKDKNSSGNNHEKIVWERAALVKLLEKRLDRNLERIFRLLGLYYNSADIISIYKGINSNLADIRLNAIEFLDNLLEPNLKKTLIPIIETSMLETITEVTIKSLNLKHPKEIESLEILLNQPDIKVKKAVLRLIKELNNALYLPMLLSFKPTCPRELLPSLEELINDLS